MLSLWTNGTRPGSHGFPEGEGLALRRMLPYSGLAPIPGGEDVAGEVQANQAANPGPKTPVGDAGFVVILFSDGGEACIHPRWFANRGDAVEEAFFLGRNNEVWEATRRMGHNHQWSYTLLRHSPYRRRREKHWSA